MLNQIDRLRYLDPYTSANGTQSTAVTPNMRKLDLTRSLAGATVTYSSPKI